MGVPTTVVAAVAMAVSAVVLAALAAIFRTLSRLAFAIGAFTFHLRSSLSSCCDYR